ncbi:hypothetical protein N5I87_18130 [Ralstonia sp. CHL-2022]|uniref:Uncharacterized protein n=1 Tax=Ralstonia mojiangensis TaxID=2953895 RepID=A0AAE3I5A3_9RALS|nr:hypothetical protein [Ralstonia mojiangensis]MCT7317934.1 hypothetical protein [Ralstonia mojiangensis]
MEWIDSPSRSIQSKQSAFIDMFRLVFLFEKQPPLNSTHQKEIVCQHPEDGLAIRKTRTPAPYSSARFFRANTQNRVVF